MNDILSPCLANPTTIPGCAVYSHGSCMACGEGLYPDHDHTKGRDGITWVLGIKACVAKENYSKFSNCKVTQTMRLTEDSKPISQEDLRCNFCKPTHYYQKKTSECFFAQGNFENCMIGDEKNCSMCNIGFYQSEFGGKCTKL